MSIEGTANTEYASLSGKIRTFVVDKSLSVSGACADAKATGDKIDRLLDDAAATAEEAANNTTNKRLADFLDSTFTKSDKAAQSTAVGKLDTVLRGLIGERAKVKTGSYTGTGVCGEEDPCTLTFDFKPRLVAVIATGGFGGMLWLVDAISHAISWRGDSANNTFGYGVQNPTFSGNSVSWYSTSQYPAYQGNESGKVYEYIAIG